MAALIIAGTTYQVEDQNPSVSFARGGSTSRSFNLTLRSTSRVRKREWSLTLLRMTQAQMDTLETATQSIVAVTGDIVGVSTNCLITVKDAGMQYDFSAGATVMYFTPSILMQEV